MYAQASASFPSIAAACTNAWAADAYVYSPHGGGGQCKSGLLCPIAMSQQGDTGYFACLLQHNSTT